MDSLMHSPLLGAFGNGPGGSEVPLSLTEIPEPPIIPKDRWSVLRNALNLRNLTEKVMREWFGRTIPREEFLHLIHDHPDMIRLSIHPNDDRDKAAVAATFLSIVETPATRPYGIISHVFGNRPFHERLVAAILEAARDRNCQYVEGRVSPIEMHLRNTFRAQGFELVLRALNAGEANVYRYRF